LRTEHDQAEGRDDEDLEPDIEVEDVAGQECPADAGHHQHQERKESVAPAGGVDLARGDHDADESHEGRDQRKARAEHIGRETDAEGRQPAAHGHDQRPLRQNARQQQRIGQHGRGEPDSGHSRMGAHLLANHQQDRPKGDRQGHRRDHQPVGERDRSRDHDAGQIGRGDPPHRHPQYPIGGNAGFSGSASRISLVSSVPIS
jgi:hypothetical protein